MNAFAAGLLHRAARLRLAADFVLTKTAAVRPLRVASTACWRFPIYSQNFVYQELTQLLNRGCDVKFLYSELDRSHPLPDQFAPLWKQRRRMFLADGVLDADLRYFRRRLPDKVDALMAMVQDASGLSEDELSRHLHFRQSFSFARTVEAFRPDYLHSYFFYEGSLFTLVAAHLLGIPRGISCYSDHLLDDYDLKIVPLQLRRSDLVIATSRRIKSELLDLAPGVDPGRIIVKPNAINAERFPAAARRPPVAGEPYRLVCVSRLDPKKGLTYLVRAIGLLRDAGHHVQLDIVGGVDPDQKSSAAYAERLEKDIADLDLGAMVHLRGRQPEPVVRGFLERAHLFVAPFVELPSGDKDGIATTILEAMASGLPVIATDAGSTPEVIEDGHSGLLVPQRRPDALARAIADLMHDEPRRARLAECAAARARERFDVAVCESDFHAALDRVLGAPGGPRAGEAASQPPAPFPADMPLDVESRHPVRLHAATAHAVESRTVGANLVPHAVEGAVHTSIVVVTFNNVPFNRLCLESLLDATRSLKYEVVVVDNASTDGTADYLRVLASHAPQVKTIFNDRNRGFAAATNQGLAAATGDVLVLLNNDTIVPDQWLPRLLRHLDHPSAGLIGAVTNRAGNEAQIEVPYHDYGGMRAFARACGRAHRGEAVDIRTVTMFCAAMRRDVFEQVGPLDERFEIGLFEDDDYSMRVRNAGYTVRCAEDVFVHHFGQASFGSLADGQYGALFHANRKRWEQKWRRTWLPHEARRKPAYEELVGRVRDVVRAIVPADAPLAVISKGDPALVRLTERPAWHFPLDERDGYAGHYPRDSEAAITMLEGLRSRGATFLVVPAPALWWLDHYREFGDYLHTRFRSVSPEPATCAVIDLREPPPA